MPDELVTHGVPDEVLGRLGVELWRLKVRVQAGRHDRLPDSVDRLTDLFERLGGAIEDRTGEVFRDGDVADVIASDGVVEGGPALITDTIRPAVFIRGRLLIAAQISLGVLPEDDSGSRAHD